MKGIETVFDGISQAGSLFPKRNPPFSQQPWNIYEAASVAQEAFYLADNSNEIWLDSLVISLFKEMGSKVTLVVNEGPFFDDATLAVSAGAEGGVGE